MLLLRLVFIAIIMAITFLHSVNGQQQSGVAALQQQGMTASQIHQKYPYYNYFPNSGNGPNYLYYNGYSYGDGKGESTWEKSVQSGIPGLDQQTLQYRGRQYFPQIDQTQFMQFHRPLYVDPQVSQALDLQTAQARLQQPLPTPNFSSLMTPQNFPTFNPQALQSGIQQQLFFPGR